MPIYEYQCDSCSEQFELLVRNSRQRASCPQCESKKVSRLFSTFAAHVPAGEPCRSGRCPSTDTPCQASGGCPLK